jgi:hypothetical protein
VLRPRAVLLRLCGTFSSSNKLHISSVAVTLLASYTLLYLKKIYQSIVSFDYRSVTCTRDLQGLVV